MNFMDWPILSFWTAKLFRSPDVQATTGQGPSAENSNVDATSSFDPADLDATRIGLGLRF